MNVLVISIGDREAGSTKYRISQFEPFLKERGVDLHFVHRNNVDRSTVQLAAHADVVLNQKSLFNNTLARRIVSAAKRVIFDYDDAIYTRPGKPRSLIAALRTRHRLHFWLRHSNVVIPANSLLASYAKEFTANIQVIPMSLDLNKWYVPTPNLSAEVTIGWAGAPVNIPNIERMQPVLDALLRRHNNLRLAIYSGKYPNLNIPFDYHPFKPGTEPDFIRSLDIGLLPLVDEEHARGKSPIKSIQYLACQVPVVGNSVGAANEICTADNSIRVGNDEEWIQALTHLITNRGVAASMGKAGRRHVEKHHDLNKNGQALLQCLSPGPVTSPSVRHGQR